MTHLLKASAATAPAQLDHCAQDWVPLLLEFAAAVAHAGDGEAQALPDAAVGDDDDDDGSSSDGSDSDGGDHGSDDDRQVGVGDKSKAGAEGAGAAAATDAVPYTHHTPPMHREGEEPVVDVFILTTSDKYRRRS